MKKALAPVAFGLSLAAVAACGSEAPGSNTPGHDISTPATATATPEVTETNSEMEVLSTFDDPCRVGLDRTKEGNWVSSGIIDDPTACLDLMAGKLVLVNFDVENVSPAVAQLAEDTVDDATEGIVSPEVEMVAATDEARAELKRRLGGASCIGNVVNGLDTSGAGISAIRKTMPEVYAPDTTVVAILDKTSCDSVGGEAFGIGSGGSEVYSSQLFKAENAEESQRRDAIIAIVAVHEYLHNFGAGEAGGVARSGATLLPAERFVELGMLEGARYREYDGGPHDPMGNETLNEIENLELLDLMVSLPILNRLHLAREQAGIAQPMEVPISAGVPQEFGVADAGAKKFATAELPRPVTLTNSDGEQMTFTTIAFVPSPTFGTFSIYLADAGSRYVRTVILGTTDKANEEIGIAGTRYKVGRSGLGNGAKVFVEQIA